MMGKFEFNFPKNDALSAEEYAEQQFGYPGYAHQEESNEAETGRAEEPEA